MCLQRLTKRQKFKARYMFYSSLFDVGGELIDRAMAVFLPGLFDPLCVLGARSTTF